MNETWYDQVVKAVVLRTAAGTYKVIYSIEKGTAMVFPKQEFSLYFVQSRETRFIKTNPNQKLGGFTSSSIYEISMEGRQKSQWQISSNCQRRDLRQVLRQGLTVASLPPCEPR